MIDKGEFFEWLRNLDDEYPAKLAVIRTCDAKEWIEELKCEGYEVPDSLTPEELAYEWNIIECSRKRKVVQCWDGKVIDRVDALEPSQIARILRDDPLCGMYGLDDDLNEYVISGYFSAREWIREWAKKFASEPPF